MTIWNLGSINADFVYSVPHIPAPGETLASTGRKVFLGGKGANMSVAAARAGAHVRHIGAIGSDGRWAVQRLLEYGVDTRGIAEVEKETAQAIIAVDASGENSIILHQGANVQIPRSLIQSQLAEAETGDWFVCQNETNLQVEAAKIAKDLGLKVAYAAAPFQANAVEEILLHLDFLILNEIEMQQLQAALRKTPKDLAIDTVLVTKGSEGADLYSRSNDWAALGFDAIKVQPVDTTGAGDTFTGYVLAGLERGMPLPQAIQLATKAGALMVTRHGTADVIPDLAEVQAFTP